MNKIPFPLRQQNITYTCFQRPATLAEGGRTATFTYNGDDERVKMYVADGTSSVLTRYYLGGRYELDVTLGNTREKLYLGGDAYSAPMVYVRDSNTDWVLYDIVRDYQGSITALVDNSDGTVVAEYSYDPWGRLRDPETLAIYTPGSASSPTLLLGRGYTAHEHLDWFGLINMNARLYDPALGRFLSPDPYVQAPDFSQNFNRYSYCLNNPLKYTDPTGEVFGLDDFLIAAAVGAIIGAYSGGVLANDGEYNPIKWDWQSSRTYGYMFMGGLVGGVSGYMGGVIAAADIPMANTLAIASASYINSMGTYIYTGVRTPITISFGFCSYDITNDTWGFLGKKGNKWYENLGYAFGMLPNIADINQLINSTSATLYTDNSDFISHSAIVDDQNNTLMSFGPAPTDEKVPSTLLGFALRFRRSTSFYDVHNDLPVNLIVNKYSFSLMRGLGQLLPYQGISFNCVNMASLSLWLNGIPNIGLHPYILYATTWAYSVGLRPDLFSYYLTNSYK